MDPATISLIFMGLRVLSQGLRAGGARRRFIDELEGFLLGVHQEGRTVSPEEILEWAQKAGASNAAYQQQLEEFLSIIDGAAPFHTVVIDPAPVGEVGSSPEEPVTAAPPAEGGDQTPELGSEG